MITAFERKKKSMEQLNWCCVAEVSFQEKAEVRDEIAAALATLPQNEARRVRTMFQCDDYDPFCRAAGASNAGLLAQHGMAVQRYPVLEELQEMEPSELRLRSKAGPALRLLSRTHSAAFFVAFRIVPFRSGVSSGGLAVHAAARSRSCRSGTGQYLRGFGNVTHPEHGSV